MTVNIKSAVLEKLEQYKRNQEERENECYANIGYLENEIERLENELITTENRYLIEGTGESKKTYEQVSNQLEELKKDLQLENRFLANKPRRDKAKLELTEEEKTSLLADLAAFTEPINPLVEDFNAKGKAFIKAYNDLMETYEPIEEVFDLAVALIGSVCGTKEQRKIIMKTSFMNPNGLGQNIVRYKNEISRMNAPRNYFW
ncbi:hypothetical protein [Lysinibacillus sp. RS5]